MVVAAGPLARSTLETVSVLELSRTGLDSAGITSGPLELRRAWPRSPHHLGLEYRAPDGCTIAGQWFCDLDQLEHVFHATSLACVTPQAAVVAVPSLGVLLQAGGADRRLPGLAPLVAQQQGTLLVHRPERRAVVRLEIPDGPCYAKVVRPQRVGALVRNSSTVRHLNVRAFSIPDLLELDAKAGVILSSAVPGVSLYHLLNSERVVPAARATGAALRALHGAAPSPNVALHSADDEMRVVTDWCERASAFAPDLHAALAAASTRVLAALSAAASPLALVHRDFYDKQVFVDARDRIALLDLDTLAMGEAALDVANALVHFELRALQGRCSPQLAAAGAAALLEGYGPSPPVRRRIGAYADATRLRLACVYTFRPHRMPVVPVLLAQIGRPVARETVGRSG